jgi:hypothetical protein
MRTQDRERGLSAPSRSAQRAETLRLARWCGVGLVALALLIALLLLALIRTRLRLLLLTRVLTGVLLARLLTGHLLTGVAALLRVLVALSFALLSHRSHLHAVRDFTSAIVPRNWSLRVQLGAPTGL